MPKQRKTYTDEERTKVLTAYRERNLTAAKVKKEFNVGPATFYSWLRMEREQRGTRGGASTPTDMSRTVHPTNGDPGDFTFTVTVPRSNVQEALQRVVLEHFAGKTTGDTVKTS